MKSTTKQEKQFPHKQYPFFKATAFLLILMLTINAFTGCQNTVISAGTPTQPDSANSVLGSSQALNLGYSQEDSLNPFYMTTDINSDLISLVFEPLFNLDDSFNAKENLATSSSMSETSLTVKLDTSAAFSDGIQFSSSDVVYSFNIAKMSEKYKNELLYISSVTATAPDTVVFTLSSAVSNATDSLTFPIVKTGTAESEDSLPVGTGLYSYSSENTAATLNYNAYCRKPQPNIAKINLIAITSASTLLHTLELGKIDAFFDDYSTGSYSSANASSSKTNLSNLVFLGMNGNSYGLNSTAIRKAVYYSINRQSIAKNSFKNYAVASAVPYHPEWHVLSDSGLDISALTLDYSIANEMMEKTGITTTLNYDLIVYSGNNFKVAAAKEIQESLKNINMNITIKELTWDEYMLALENGSYDLYIGEIKLPANMDMSALYGAQSPVYGALPLDTTASAYTEYLNGKTTLEQFTNTFVNNIPFAPICFRMGSLIYSNSISPAADCDLNNVYKNIYEWKK